ncbi:MAG: hypothetical protein AAF559_06775 [Pseudomonadota bacterium]
MRIIAALTLCLTLAACGAPENDPVSGHDEHSHNEQGHEEPARDSNPGGPGLPLVPDIADEEGSEEDVADEAKAARIPVSFRGA